MCVWERERQGERGSNKVEKICPSEKLFLNFDSSLFLTDYSYRYFLIFTLVSDLYFFTKKNLNKVLTLEAWKNLLKLW